MESKSEIINACFVDFLVAGPAVVPADGSADLTAASSGPPAKSPALCVPLASVRTVVLGTVPPHPY